MTCQQTAVVRDSKVHRKDYLPGKHESRNLSYRVFPEFLISLALVLQDFRNFLNCVPIAVRSGNTEELLDPAKITDRFHLPSIKAQNEFVLDCDDFEKPVIGRREIEGQRREF